MRFAACLCLLGVMAPQLNADKPPPVKTAFDLIPANSAAGFAVHNLKELQTQGDRFLKNTGLQDRFGIRPSQAVQFVFGFLGLNQSRDDTLPAGVFVANLIEARILNPAEFGKPENFLVVGVGFHNIDEMASNFGLRKGQLKPGEIIEIRKKQFGKFAYVRGQHIYIGDNKRAILSVAQGKRLSETMKEKTMKRLERSDMVFHAGTNAWGFGWAKFVQELHTHLDDMRKKNLEVDPDTGLSAKILQLIADSLPALENLMIAAAIDDQGLELQVLTRFRPERIPAAGQLLKLLRGGDEPSSLNDLPRKNLIAGQAVRSDGSQNRALVRALLDAAFNFWIDDKKLIAVAERPKFVGLFDHVWQRLRGSQFGVYSNDAADQGLFSMVAVLDTEDPKEFLREMRELARFAKPGELKLEGDDASDKDVATVKKLIEELGDDNFRTRHAATLKLRLIGPPAVPYLEKALDSPDREVVARSRRLLSQIQNVVEAREKDVLAQTLLGKLNPRWGDFPNAETRNGYTIDIVKMDLQGADEKHRNALKDIFGPDWSKIRLVVHQNKIVVLMGSNVSLLDKTLKQFKQPSPNPIANLENFRKRAPQSRRTEIHTNLMQFVSKLVPAGGQEKPKASMTSISLGVDNDTIELHLWAPNDEVRAVSLFR